MPSPRWRLSAESVTAVAAVVTAVVALAVGVWQTAETRRHNRLSVRPLLDVDFSVDVSPEAQRLSVEVANRGLGLAEAERTRISFRTRSGNVETYDSWGPARPAIEAFDVLMLSRTALHDGDLLEPGESKTLLEVQVNDPTEFGALQEIIERLAIEITYVSMYEETFVASFGG